LFDDALLTPVGNLPMSRRVVNAEGLGFIPSASITSLRGRVPASPEGTFVISGTVTGFFTPAN
jgi:hypothetical protein